MDKPDKLCVKVPLKEAEKAKRELVKSDLLDKSRTVAKDEKFIYYPVTARFKSKHDFVEKESKKRNITKDLKGHLSGKLSEDELAAAKRSVDVIGNIAIIEVPEELMEKEKIIAEETLRINPAIKTVLRKGKHEGVFRTQKLKYLAGVDTRESICKENNVILKLDVENVYFSPRLSNERKRIMQLVKQGEDVLVMFSGCGPYTCTIAKNSSANSVDGVEINPAGHEYALRNIAENRLKNARTFCGDVREIVPKLGKKYDRILMPLPMSAADYLDVAIGAAKKGTTIHFYDFQKEDEKDVMTAKIKLACEKAKVKFKVIDIVRCGQFAPKMHRYCVDFRLI